MTFLEKILKPATHETSLSPLGQEITLEASRFIHNYNEAIEHGKPAQEPLVSMRDYVEAHPNKEAVLTEMRQLVEHPTTIATMQCRPLLNGTIARFELLGDLKPAEAFAR